MAKEERVDRSRKRPQPKKKATNKAKQPTQKKAAKVEMISDVSEKPLQRVVVKTVEKPKFEEKETMVGEVKINVSKQQVQVQTESIPVENKIEVTEPAAECVIHHEIQPVEIIVPTDQTPYGVHYKVVKKDSLLKRIINKVTGWLGK